MAFYQYSPDQCSLSWNGCLINAFADGTFITVEFNADNWTTHVGSLGDVTRTKNLDRTAKVTVRIMAQAPVNDALYALARADMDTGFGYGPFAFDEAISNTRVHGAYVWVTKIPKMERAKESGECEWEFTVADCDIVIGGSLIVGP